MPAIEVPAGVPCPQTSGVTPEEGRLLSESARAPRQERTVEQDERQYQTFTFTFKEEQAAAFRDWWRDDLIEGGAWFSAPETWPQPEGLLVNVRRFIGAPAWSYLGVGVWRVSIDAEVRGETLLPNGPSGGVLPWLYYPTQDWPEQDDDSLAPIHRRTFEFAPITVAPEPFVNGVGVTDTDGFGTNVGSVRDVIIALRGDSGVPTEGQYTWEPADPEDGVTPVFSDVDPSGGVWVGPNLFVALSSSPSGWAGGVLTLYAGNNPSSGAGQTTIITFLPGTFVYPPVSVFYGPLA